MKFLIGAVALFTSVCSTAQSVDIKNVEADKEGATTIEIRKGKSEYPQGKAIWEISDGESDIMGDVKPLEGEAKESWKSACKTWEKQFRLDNKENKIINVSCGSPTCSGDTGRKSCVSKASYKIKTRLD